MIPDAHLIPEGWGIRPVLFSAGPLSVTAYAFFVLLGLAAAIILYIHNTRGRRTGNGLAIAGAALVGGILGAKIPIWIANLPAIIADVSAASLMSGRTIVGGLIGGVCAVWLVKRRLGIRERLGNHLVPSLALGVAVGRIGCYLAGCCYGVATTLPWGVDFGDHVTRHPTQLYEVLFALAVFVIAQVTLEQWEPGMLFRWFMIAYFAWRFLIEFIRANPASMLGLSYYQHVAVAIVVLYGARMLTEKRRGGLDER